MKGKYRKYFAAVSVSLLVLVAAIMLTVCGGTTSIFSLSNAPSGFAFTDVNGTFVRNLARGAEAQLRDAAQNILLSFLISDNVSFSSVVADRDATKTLVHFASTNDKDGVGDTLTLYVPCTADTNEVHVCPQASSMDRIVDGCSEEQTLTAASPTGGGYTWANVSTRSGTEDCQITSSTDNFGTGAFGAATGAPTLTAADFPDVGICDTGTIDVTSQDLKDALAAATSMTFLHKPYGSDADIPFICGLDGVWDPSDADAFDSPAVLIMTDTINAVFTGATGTGNVFICNTGFELGLNNQGFHAANTYRGEITFTDGTTTYRGRLRFSVTGADADATLASLGLTPGDVTLQDSNGTQLVTVDDIRDLLAVNPVSITVSAVSDSTTHVTTTGGFICAGTQ